MTTDGHLVSDTFPSAYPSSLRSWDHVDDDSYNDESAPMRMAPYPSLSQSLSNDLSTAFDPALCITPEKKLSSFAQLRRPLPDSYEDDSPVEDHRATKVHFDHTVSVHHLSPDYGCAGIPTDDRRISPVDRDNISMNCDELDITDLSDGEPISIIARDLRRLSPNSLTLLNTLESSRCLQGRATERGAKTVRTLSPQVVTEFGSTDGILADSVAQYREPSSAVEPECVLARPEFNSTLKLSRDISNLQGEQFDLTTVAMEKIHPKLKQQVREKACLKVNPSTVVYPDLISLEVTESDLLNQIADEHTSRVRSTDSSNKQKPEDKVSRPPDILDFFTSDLQKEAASVNLVAVPEFELTPQTAELDRAFDLYRHIRTWNNL